MMKKTNEVSKLVGVSKRTLQYYDDEGLLFIERASNNHRLYDQKTLERIWQILVYKEMGFELREIKCLLEFSDNQKKICLEQRMEEIKNQVMELKMQMKWILSVQNHGIPPVPIDTRGITYMESIVELREKIKTESMEEESL